MRTASRSRGIRCVRESRDSAEHPQSLPIVLALDEAQDRILGASFAFGKATKQFSETVPEGIVIASDPKAGATLRFGTIVDLVISKGRQPIPVV